MSRDAARRVLRRSLTGGLVVVVVIGFGTAATVQLRQSAVDSGQLPAAAISGNGASPGNAAESTRRTSPGPIAGTGTSGRAAASPTDLPVRDRLIGVWSLQRHGERTLSLREDGTATANVNLDMVAALLYGPDLVLDVIWSLEGDLLTQTITSGQPKDAVARLIRDWGGRRQYRVVDVTESRLVLVEVDDDDRQEWTAVGCPALPSHHADTPSAREGE